MELTVQIPPQKYARAFSAAFLAALLCTILATLDMLSLAPIALACAVLSMIDPKKSRRITVIAVCILAAFLLIRFSSILSGMKQLANRLFFLSEQTQAYEYTYFRISEGAGATEAVLWLSLLASFLCGLWGNRFCAVLAAAWAFAMAYFGVTPSGVWLFLSAFAGTAAVLPSQKRWLHAFFIGILTALIFLACMLAAPNPSEAVSDLDEHLRDILSVNSAYSEQTPIPTEVPAPQIVPPPASEQQAPDHGVRHAVINALFLFLAALTLAILFIPAVIKDRAGKRSEKNRAGLHDPDNAAAIQAAYLYARRWRALDAQPADIPPEIYALWQEAAFSNHAMTQAQRDIMYRYMEQTASAVWEKANRRRRLHIRYRIAL